MNITDELVSRAVKTAKEYNGKPPAERTELGRRLDAGEGTGEGEGGSEMSESLRDQSPYVMRRFTYFASMPSYVPTFGSARHHGWGGKSQKKIRRERRQRGWKK